MRCRESESRLPWRRLLAALAAACAVLAPGAPAAAADEPDPIAAAAADAYWRGDFPALEEQYRELRRGQPLLEDGASRLELFRSGLGRVTATTVKYREPYLRELEALTLQWATEHPKSSLAHVMHASALAAHGWSYRGTGYANTVTPEAFEQFHAYLRRAAEYLKAHADVAMTDSYAYLKLVQIGRGLGWDPAELELVAEAGLKLAPQDVELYFSTLESFLPKWGGNLRMLDDYIRNLRMLDDYIRRVAERTKGEYGDGMYARLYSAAADEQFSNGLFKDSYADWPRMKRGYEDMHARYPNSPTRRNRFAYMACLAKDRPTLLALLAELGPRLEGSQWGNNGERTLEGCQRWAAET